MARSVNMTLPPLLESSGTLVVVVEDDDLVRDLAVCELEESGYDVEAFDTADAALPMLRTRGAEVAVLVTDVQMPGQINGLAFAQLVGDMWPGMPILITSGGPLVDPSRLPPAALFLAKPWRPADLVAWASCLAGRRRVAGPPLGRPADQSGRLSSTSLTQ